MRDLLRDTFPEWKKSSAPVFSLLTDGEDEKLWIQQPLRHAFKQFLASKKSPYW